MCVCYLIHCLVVQHNWFQECHVIPLKLLRRMERFIHTIHVWYSQSEENCLNWITIDFFSIFRFSFSRTLIKVNNPALMPNNNVIPVGCSLLVSTDLLIVFSTVDVSEKVKLSLPIVHDTNVVNHSLTTWPLVTLGICRFRIVMRLLKSLLINVSLKFYHHLSDYTADLCRNDVIKYCYKMCL